MNNIEKNILKECNKSVDKVLIETKEKTKDLIYECVLTKDEYNKVFYIVNQYYKMLNFFHDKINFLIKNDNLKNNSELYSQIKLIEEINDKVLKDN